MSHRGGCVVMAVYRWVVTRPTRLSSVQRTVRHACSKAFLQRSHTRPCLARKGVV